MQWQTFRPSETAHARVMRASCKHGLSKGALTEAHVPILHLRLNILVCVQTIVSPPHLVICRDTFDGALAHSRRGDLAAPRLVVVRRADDPDVVPVKRLCSQSQSQPQTI